MAIISRSGVQAAEGKKKKQLEEESKVGETDGDPGLQRYHSNWAAAM